MNLGYRCNAMLPNQCQCPNTVIDGTDLCKLHTAVLKNSGVPEETHEVDNDSTGFKQE